MPEEVLFIMVVESVILYCTGRCYTVSIKYLVKPITTPQI